MTKKCKNGNKDDTLSKIVVSNATCFGSAYEWNEKTNTYTLPYFDSKQIWLLLLLLYLSLSLIQWPHMDWILLIQQLWQRRYLWTTLKHARKFRIGILTTLSRYSLCSRFHKEKFVCFQKWNKGSKPLTSGQRTVSTWNWSNYSSFSGQHSSRVTTPRQDAQDVRRLFGCNSIGGKSQKVDKGHKMEGLGSILSRLPQGNYLKRRCPFYYIVCKNDLPDKKPDVNFLDDYIMNAPLTGKEFTIDVS